MVSNVLYDNCPPPTHIMGSPLFDHDNEATLLDALHYEEIHDGFLNTIQSDDNLYIDDKNYSEPDVKMPLQPFNRIGPPARGNMSGSANFDACVTIDNGDKKQYSYSAELNRVYLGIKTELPIEFKWNMNMLCDRQLWIRATIILAGSEQQESRVLRCYLHIVKEDPSNRDVPESIHAHVLRSARQADDIVYCGDKDDDQSWLGVAFPVQYPPAGVNAISHVYRFFCKHSCSSGINRRRIEVLFTLEDSLGEIYGRKAIGVRVCSCPKRDMDKDLLDYKQRRDGSPPRKRQLIVNARSGPTYVMPTPRNNTHDQVVHNLNFPIIGTHNYNHLLTTAYALMAGDLLKLAPNDNKRLNYIQCMRQIEAMLQNCNANQNT